MSSPLSDLQKREVSIAARQAYDVWPEREAFAAINPEFSATARFDAWRRAEQEKAVGISSLRACTQEHYGRLLGHFQALAGHTAAATRTLARDADNGRRIARYKLDQALGERGLSPGYAATICQAKFKCPLQNATEKQLWKLVFDVRSRRKAPPAATSFKPDDLCPW